MDRLKLLDNRHFLSIFIALTALLWPGGAVLWTDPPLHPGNPFLFMWNGPSERCETHFDMPLDLSHFEYISSTLKSATNQTITLFYTDRFGIFPHINEKTGEIHDPGLPQLVDMVEHEKLATKDIEHYIPSNQTGLAIIDFEEWRPEWVRNWGSKAIYRRVSIDVVKKRDPTLSDKEAATQAKIEFEEAAKNYFIHCIRIGKKLRPNRLWGYYLYPDCYNYGFNKDLASFTGKCPPLEQKRNDQLMWLWAESQALFPSIYLELKLKNTIQARNYVRYRMMESIRVSMLPVTNYSIPIHAYIRPVYKDFTENYMTEFDLVNTIGEAAALGAASVICWGDMDVVKSESSCDDARRHLTDIMNPYMLNVSTATQLCSQALCSGRGRCMRKRWEDDVYLHLDPRRYRIRRRGPGARLTVSGNLSQADVNWLERRFDCVCYSEEPCYSVMIIPNVTTTSHGAHGPRPLLLVLRLISVMFVLMWK